MLLCKLILTTGSRIRSLTAYFIWISSDALLSCSSTSNSNMIFSKKVTCFKNNRKTFNEVPKIVGKAKFLELVQINWTEC